MTDYFKLAEWAGIQRIHRKTIVFTNGCFDLFHAGHARLLMEAKVWGNLLVVGLNSDASVRRLKGEHRPIVPQAERAELLLACRCVDAVFIFDDDTPQRAIETVSPDYLVKGGDYEGKKIVGHDFVIAHGGAVRFIPLSQGPCRSTSAIIERIRALD